jgi:CSLREA domain-containing protein
VLRLALLAFAAVALLSAPSSWATNFTVTNTSLNPTDAGSLLYALGHLASGSAATTNTITITATGTITLTSPLPPIVNGVTITGPGANQLTISGANSYQVFLINNADVAISGLSIVNGRGYLNYGNHYGGGVAQFGGVVTINACVFSGNEADFGGAIYDQGTMTVSNSTFQGNTATTSDGGAIYNFSSTLKVTNSTFYDNTSLQSGGGAIYNYGTTSVTNSTFTGNSVPYGNGGAISDIGGFQLTLNNNIFTGNTSAGGGAGIYNAYDTINTSDNIYYNNLTGTSEDDCLNCSGNGTSSGNVSATSNPLLPLGNYGGTTETLALAPGSAAICAGSSADAVDAKSNPLTSDQRGFAMDPTCAPGSVDAGAVQTNQYVVTTLADQTDASPTCTEGATCSLRDAISLANTTSGDIIFLASLTSTSKPGTILLGQGSAGDIALPAITGQANIFGLGANQLIVSGNLDTNVGSVFTVNSGATATLYGLTIANGISGNASASGGGIDNAGTLTVLNSAVSGNQSTNGAFGGGFYSTGTLVIQDSTVSGNTSGFAGGGIANNNGTLTINSSTISGNTVTDTGAIAAGGGVFSLGSFTLTSSTVSANTASCNICADGSAGGGIYNSSSTLTLNNSIVAGNIVSVSGSGTAIYADIYGNYIDDGGNVASGDSSATSDFATTLQLSPLQYNGAGSALQTLIPIPGSPAICAGLQSNIPSGVATDERGFPNTTTYPGYASNPCMDAGAVQTNYTSIAFAQQPGDTKVNTAITPSPAVEVIETNTITGATDMVSGVPIWLDYSGGAGEISGGSASLSATTGAVKVGTNTVNEAVFGLTPNTAGTGFTLSLGSKGNGIQVVTGDTLTATSNSFNVNQSIPVVTANAISFVAGTGFNGQVATFNYSVPTSALSDFTATINWGDGSAPEFGTISQPGGVGTDFSVAGSHTYVFSGSYTITVTVTPADGSASSGTNTETVSAAVATQIVVNYPTPVYAGIPETGTVVVEDAYGNVETAMNGTATVTTSESTTAIPVTINSGFGTFVASFATARTNQSITAAFSSLTGVPATGITVNAIPSLVVTSTADFGKGSLRAALATAATDGAGNITFDPGVFATAQTINLTSGTLEVPANTIITGPTTGSGATLTNLVTISGGSPSNGFTIFDVYAGNLLVGVGNSPVTTNSGTLTPDVPSINTNAPAAISNLIIENGSNSGNGGGGIENERVLTLTHDVFTGNSATGGASGGAVLNGNVLNVVNCTFSGNSQSGSGGAGGAIFNGGGGTVTITGSTFSGNTSSSNAGAILNNDLLTVTNSTFTGNVAAASGGAIASGHGSLTVTNSTFSANVAGTSAGGIGLGPGEGFTLADSIVSGNWLGTATSVTKYDDLDDKTKSATFTSNNGNYGGNIVGYYNSPTATAPTPSIGLAPLANYGGSTQTMIPLPGSPAICAGTAAQPGPEALLSPDAKPLLVTLPTTDQRGLGLDANCPSGSADVGAVQTNYSIAFTTEPEPVSPAMQIVALAPFQAAVTLTENGVAFFDGTDTIPIPLTLTTGPGALGGGSVSTSATTGIATYSALRISLPGTNDQLTAKLTLNSALTPAPGLVLTQTSSLFNVDKVPTTTTLGVSIGSGTPSSSISITPGESLKLTATVAASGIEPTDGGTALTSADVPAIGIGTLNGTVSFYDGSTLLGTVNLSAGTATYSIDSLAPGVTHTLTATYNGNAEFATSSNTSTATVTVAPLEFTMTLSGPSSQTVVPGGTIVYTVKVDPDYGSYAGPVSFTVTGLPPGASVTFSPKSIAANGGPQTITVTIQTAAATAMLHASAPTPSAGSRLTPFALAFLLLFGAGSMRRRGKALRRMLCVIALLAGGAASVMLSGCGGGINGFFAQSPHNYTITITATAGGLTQIETVTLNVQ